MSPINLIFFTAFGIVDIHTKNYDKQNDVKFFIN